MLKRHAELSRLNHFEVLEVTEDAGHEEIRSAFQRVAFDYHPDRLCAEEERLRPLAAAIFNRIAEAYRVLDDRGSRARYLHSLRPKLPLDLEGSEAPDAEPDRVFQAARICLKRGRLDDALVLVGHARRLKPRQPQYAALQAWLRVLSNELRSREELEGALSLLTRALRERSDDLELRMYRGRVLQRLGRNDDALVDFRHVARADRRNVEAARELHLHEVRESLKPASVSGTFARIFRR